MVANAREQENHRDRVPAVVSMGVAPGHPGYTVC